MRRILLILLGVLLLLLIATGGVFLWLLNADLRMLAERVASDALGRPVTAEALEIRWGDPIGIELRNLRIANAPWGSTPAMISLKGFSASLDPFSLWQGTPRYEHLRAEGLVVVLERDAEGVGNWKFDSDGGNSGGGDDGFALIPKNRTQFPTLIDMVLRDGLITYRTYAGNVLRIQLDEVGIQSEGSTTPVKLAASGAYNNTPLTLAARTQSFAVLRDAAIPFGTVFTLAGHTARVDFDGTLMEPLDFDGVNGRMELDAGKLANLLASFGVVATADYPLRLAGHLTRVGDHWQLDDAEGKLAADDFSGALRLDEGSRGGPDDIGAELGFARLDLDALIGGGDSETAGADLYDMSLLVPRDAGMTLAAKLNAGEMVYTGKNLADFELGFRLEAGHIALETLAFAYAGGRIGAAAEATTREGQSDLHLDVRLNEIDADLLAQELGAGPGDLTGRVDGMATLEMHGDTLRAALGHSEGALLLAMTEGSVRRAIIEQASTDLRTLFRERADSAPVGCFGVLVSLKDGIASVAPLRLESAAGTLSGGGTVDLLTRTVDLGVRAERESTGFFALDLPIRIGGTLDDLTAGLAGEGEKDWQPAGGTAIDQLDPEMRQLAARNPCLP